ncbi:zinc-ribbon domain-containing protein [Catenulispora pinisilvae]|uniref:zinc-ribbon domain-containing protein n=1 Tax=Catenulispora pinisilvae TaxID=2705253 RepID=UPI00189152F6|nr:zinc-ribbon domain-containing protein [Catenulispora pinisilvae]
MIIWGWKTVFRVIGSGVFSCPACGADRNYERRKAQRFFTLFFIPLIPLKVVGEFVRCTYCKNDFQASVLSRPTAAQFTDLLQNSVRGVMVNVLRRGAWDHPAARAAAVQEIVTAGAVGYAEPNLAQDMQVVPDDLSQMLAALAQQLPDPGREALVTGAARVAAADGPIQPAERAIIDAVGASLGLSQPHVAGIVAAVVPGQGAAQAQAQAPAPVWGSAAPAAGGETMLIQAPQPAPATGAQDAVPANAGSGMETMLIQTPQPAPPAAAEDAAPQHPSSMETMFIPVQPPAPAQQPAAPAPASEPPTMVDTSAGMETMAIPIPRPVDPADEPTHVTRADEPGPGAWPPPHQQ